MSAIGQPFRLGKEVYPMNSEELLMTQRFDRVVRPMLYLVVGRAEWHDTAVRTAEPAPAIRPGGHMMDSRARPADKAGQRSNMLQMPFLGCSRRALRHQKGMSEPSSKSLFDDC